jgi:hypothetical protein
MIDLLKLSHKHGQLRLQEAIESALANHCYDAAAVQHLLSAEELRHKSCEPMMSVGWNTTFDLCRRCRNTTSCSVWGRRNEHSDGAVARGGDQSALQ